MIPAIHSKDFQFSTPLGYRIFGKHIISPISMPPSFSRTVILIPPPKQGMDFFLNASPLHWKKWLLLGCNIILFDPLGCGESWGTVNWGGKEDQASIRGLIEWANSQGDSKIVLVSFWGSIISAILAQTSCPLIAFEPVYSPDNIASKHPELSKKSRYFWKERTLQREQLQKVAVLPLQPSSLREKLHRRRILLGTLLLRG